MIPEDEIIAVLPETEQSLQALAHLNQDNLVAHLQAWEVARRARLRHLHVRLTEDQLTMVEEALSKVLREAQGMSSGNPNRRGNALHLVCERFLQWNERQ